MDELIAEGIVTTLGSNGSVNVAPMGPRMHGTERLVFRLYPGSATLENLRRTGEGVFHITDDVWLLARAAVGQPEPGPATFPARRVRGQVLADACRFYEFIVAEQAEIGTRLIMVCQVVHWERLRDFFGFNRGKHAVVEAAILASRRDRLPLDMIQAEYRRLAPLVEKTGGEQERRAFALLQDYIRGRR